MGYYLDRITRGLIDLGQAGLDLESILSRYGLNPTEKIFNYVAADLFRNAVEQGTDVKVHHFAHLSLPTDGEPILYIATENNYVRRITRNTNVLVDNGTDGVLFLSSKYTAPFDIPDELVSDNGLIRSLILDKIPFDMESLTREESEILLLGEIFALLMRDAIPDTKPIFAFIGEKGSGKTTAVRMFGRTLYGPTWDVIDITEKVRDFDTLISTDDFVCFDNADENVKWLNNKFAIAASGGKVVRNVLYKTHQQAEYPIISMIAATSRTPCFRRDDVADRLVVLNTIRLERPDQSDFNADVLDEVLSKRKELWGELIYHIQAILKVLHEPDWRSIQVRGARLQGFARFTVVVARALGCEKIAYKAWEKMKVVQREFAIEGEVLFDVLSEWVPVNQGREVTAGELAPELAGIAKNHKLDWPYNNGKSLGQKLSHLMADLKDIFDMSFCNCPTKKQMIYTFRPKGEPGINFDSGSIPEAIPGTQTGMNKGV
ncbi:MAG: hypothetical protein ABIC40_06965 [bacterium]